MRSRGTSWKLARWACRGAGTEPSTFLEIAGTPGPEMRTTPIPPRPGAVAIAAMVSRLAGAGSRPGRSALGMGRLVAVEHALDLPLLGDGKDVIDQPVTSQTGRGK